MHLSRRDFIRTASRVATSAAFGAAITGPPRLGITADASLRELADRIGFTIGCELTGWWFRNPTWQSTVAREFNLGAIAWGMHWSEIEPKRDEFEFDVVDGELDFTAAHGMRARAQHLVWRNPSLLPSWLLDGGFSRVEMIRILQNHIQQIVSRYRGRISEWVVVNEPYLPPYRPTDIFHEAIGPEYIEIAFQAAREADPSATLLFNDTQNHIAAGFSSASNRSIVQRLRAQGLIDGLGLQMHLLQEHARGERVPATRDVIDTARSYGLPIHISEFDVNLQGIAGSTDERYDLQARIYADMLAASLESGVCGSFTVWGIGDRFSWYEQPPTQPDADPTPFDDALSPKPAYYAMMDVLRRAGG